jgi:hypothetical protein
VLQLQDDLLLDRRAAPGQQAAQPEHGAFAIAERAVLVQQWQAQDPGAAPPQRIQRAIDDVWHAALPRVGSGSTGRLAQSIPPVPSQHMDKGPPAGHPKSARPGGTSTVIGIHRPGATPAIAFGHAPHQALDEWPDPDQSAVPGIRRAAVSWHARPAAP